MTITLTREEAQQVLKTITLAKGYIFHNVLDDKENPYDAAIELLRARLAQPEPEPMAWMHRQGNYRDPHWMRLDDDAKAKGWTEEPLYTAPPQRKEWRGLTDEEVEIETARVLTTLTKDVWPIALSRAIEKLLRRKNT